MILASGTIATLISGFHKQNLSHSLGIDITGYGLPLSWYRESQIVYPYMPVVYSLHWECFALDIVFWSLLISIPVAFLTRRKHNI